MQWKMSNPLPPNSERDLDIYLEYGIIDQTSERIAVMRHDVEEEFSIWFKDVTRLATLLGTPPISTPRAPRSAQQMHRIMHQAHPQVNTTCATRQSRFVITRLQNFRGDSMLKAERV